MKKPAEKRRVHFDASKGWLQNYGEQIWLRKHWRIFGVGLLISIGLIVSWLVFEGALDKVVESVLVSTVVILFAVSWFLPLILMGFAGSKYWKSTKDKEEPIELEPLPNWWGK